MLHAATLHCRPSKWLPGPAIERSSLRDPICLDWSPLGRHTGPQGHRHWSKVPPPLPASFLALQQPHSAPAGCCGQSASTGGSGTNLGSTWWAEDRQRDQQVHNVVGHRRALSALVTASSWLTHIPPCTPPTRQAFSLAILFRCWNLLSPTTTAWLAGSIMLSAVDAAWRESAPGSYARWREAPAAASRLLAFSLGPTWVLMRAVLDDQAAPEAGGSVDGAHTAPATGMAAEAALWAAHLARLLFASGAPKMAANALSLRTRLG